jgi:hypothetical protein
VSALKRIIAFLARIVGYASLAIVLAAAAILLLFGQTNLCPSFHEGRVACASPLYQGLGEFAMAVVLMTAFTGLPLLFALLGAVFAVKDLRRWRALRAKQPPSIL